jgi:hypothetical protein
MIFKASIKKGQQTRVFAGLLVIKRGRRDSNAQPSDRQSDMHVVSCFNTSGYIAVFD